MNVDLRNMNEAFIKAVEKTKRENFQNTNSKAVIKMVLEYHHLKNEIEVLKKERNKYKFDLEKIENKYNILKNALKDFLK